MISKAVHIVDNIPRISKLRKQKAPKIKQVMSAFLEREYSKET